MGAGPSRLDTVIHRLYTRLIQKNENTPPEELCPLISAPSGHEIRGPSGDIIAVLNPTVGSMDTAVDLVVQRRKRVTEKAGLSDAELKEELAVLQQFRFKVRAF
jgi:hypothetical protein